MSIFRGGALFRTHRVPFHLRSNIHKTRLYLISILSRQESLKQKSSVQSLSRESPTHVVPVRTRKVHGWLQHDLVGRGVGGYVKYMSCVTLSHVFQPFFKILENFLRNKCMIIHPKG